MAARASPSERGEATRADKTPRRAKGSNPKHEPRPPGVSPNRPHAPDSARRRGAHLPLRRIGRRIGKGQGRPARTSASIKRKHVKSAVRPEVPARNNQGAPPKRTLPGFATTVTQQGPLRLSRTRVRAWGPARRPGPESSPPAPFGPRTIPCRVSGSLSCRADGRGWNAIRGKGTRRARPLARRGGTAASGSTWIRWTT